MSVATRERGTDQGPPDAGRPVRFTRRDIRTIGLMYGSAALLGVVAWLTFLHYQHAYGAAYAATGSLAFGFGIRHAFDADHISAIDDTTRYLMQQGKRRQSVGYFFALGHSTVVIALTLGIALSAEAVQRQIPRLQSAGSTIGSLVSGLFLLAIATLDAFILAGVVDVWRKAKQGTYCQEDLDQVMVQRGFINRLLGRRWRRFISDSWQMYPVGILFGLGFDTATQVGVVALTAAAATGHVNGHRHGAPFGALLALPLLYTAGMVLMDTTDGVVMTQAYGWAFMSPFRKMYYNMATVGLGIFIAGAVGGLE